jgi:hypothetical protein
MLDRPVGCFRTNRQRLNAKTTRTHLIPGEEVVQADHLSIHTLSVPASKIKRASTYRRGRLSEHLRKFAKDLRSLLGVC